MKLILIARDTISRSISNQRFFTHLNVNYDNEKEIYEE